MASITSAVEVSQGVFDVSADALAELMVRLRHGVDGIDYFGPGSREHTNMISNGFQLDFGTGHTQVPTAHSVL